MNIFIETVEVYKWTVYGAIFYIFVMQFALSAYIAKLCKEIKLKRSQILVKPNREASPQKLECEQEQENEDD